MQMDLWLDFIKQIRPLNKKRQAVTEIHSPLKVKRAPGYEILTTLDLHGVHIQEAYDITKHFILLHYTRKTPTVMIITGKGLNGQGKIKNEITNWLDTPFFKEKINETQWINGGGQIKITLKRSKHAK